MGTQPRTGVGSRSHDVLPPRTVSKATHRRLLEEALLLFGERGFHGVSMREIASATGVRAASIYEHVRSKEELLMELVLRGHEEQRARLREVLLETGPDPVEQARQVVRAHVLMHCHYPLLARVCNRELHALSRANRQRIEDIREDSRQLFLEVLGRGIDRGLFQVEDSWLATAAISAMGVRIAEWWEYFPVYAPETVADQYAEFALRILIPDRDSSPARAATRGGAARVRTADE